MTVDTVKVTLVSKGLIMTATIPLRANLGQYAPGLPLSESAVRNLPVSTVVDERVLISAGTNAGVLL